MSTTEHSSVTQQSNVTYYELHHIYIYTYYEAQCSRVSTTWAFEGRSFVFATHRGQNMACLRIIFKLIYIYYTNYLQCKKSRLTLSSSLVFPHFPFFSSQKCKLVVLSLHSTVVSNAFRYFFPRVSFYANLQSFGASWSYNGLLPLYNSIKLKAITLFRSIFIV
jgi:hypothetical protein